MASGFLLNQPSDTGGLSHRLAYVTNLIGLQVSRCAPTPFNRTMAVLPGFTAFRYREPSGRISRASDEAPVPGFSPLGSRYPLSPLWFPEPIGCWFPEPSRPCPLVPGTDWVGAPFGSRCPLSVPGTKAPGKALRYREPKPPGSPRKPFGTGNQSPRSQRPQGLQPEIAAKKGNPHESGLP